MEQTEFKSKTITVLDGGMGRELKRMGAPFRVPEWSSLALMDAPDFVAQAHANFVAAGAEVITTNAYAVVPAHLGPQRFAERGFDLAQLSGQLARAAADEADRFVAVAGCLPPLFGSYEPDKFDADAAPELYKTLVEAQDEYVDIWLQETVSCIEEFDAGIDAIRKYRRHSIDAPIWAAFTLDDDNPEAPTSRSGEPIDQIVRSVNGRIDALLFNCSRPETISAAMSEAGKLLKGTKIELGAYANTFTSVDDSDEEGLSPNRTDVEAERYTEFAHDWVTAGATIVGGCCGIGPEHIKLLADTYAS